METKDPEIPDDLEETLMRWHACELTADEEQTLAERLLREPAARWALVDSFLLAAEVNRVLGLCRRPEPVARPVAWRPNWLIAGAGLAAAAAAFFLALNLNRPAPRVNALPLLAPGEKDSTNPKGGEDEAARIAALIEQLGDEDPAKREAADKALRALGAPAVAQLEKAAKDTDVERSMRAKAILQAIQIAALLKEVDANFQKGAEMQADVEYATNPNNTQKSTYKHIEGGKKFAWEYVYPADPNGRMTQKQTCISDGETVWSNRIFEYQGRPPQRTITKVSLAHYEKQGLGWIGGYHIPLAPPWLLKQTRTATQFTTIKEETLDGQAVWVLEGDVAVDQRANMTVGGSANMQNGLTSVAGGMAAVQRARLIVTKAGAVALKAEGLTDQGVSRWSMKLSNVKFGEKIDPAAFKFTPPENAKVRDLEQPLGSGPNAPGQGNPGGR